MKYGIIGEKLGHSFSAPIHKQLGGYDYELHPLAPEALDGFLRERAFTAINVTIPYKRDVLPYCDFVEENAARIGAVNTLVNRNGMLSGYNTDFMGLRYLLEKNHIEIKGRKVLILGSGGTSHTAAAVCEAMGASSFLRVSRHPDKDTISYEAALTRTDTQVLINTTPCGMFPNSGEMALDPNMFPALEAVADVVYNPLRTSFVLAGKRMGIKAIGGLEMLVAQALYAAEYFMDCTLDKNRIEEIYRELLTQKSNVVLIGMPSGGKTTIGKLAAELCGKKIVDIDEEIVRSQGQTIEEIFSIYGEEKFRALEREQVLRFSAENGLLISTGGGVIKNPENMKDLMKNGVVLYLNRPKELLSPGEGRPLFRRTEQLDELLRARDPLYRAYSEATVRNDTTPTEAAQRIREKYHEILYHKWP